MCDGGNEYGELILCCWEALIGSAFFFSCSGVCIKNGECCCKNEGEEK
jgi:hypothetical protein